MAPSKSTAKKPTRKRTVKRVSYAIRQMPGEDALVKAQTEFASGLKGILDVFQNQIPSTVVAVKPGDTLWNIGELHLGSGQRWRELYMMNLDLMTRGQEAHNSTPGPNTIFPGQEMRILLV